MLQRLIECEMLCRHCGHRGKLELWLSEDDQDSGLFWWHDSTHRCQDGWRGRYELVGQRETGQVRDPEHTL